MTDAATIERVVTTTPFVLPEGVTAVENTAERGTGAHHAVYITRTQFATESEANVGTIQRCTGSTVAGAFINRDATARVWGALVNPEPVNGRTYLVKDRFIARYNDDDHRADRNYHQSPWSILSGADNAPWPYPNDSVSSLDGETYFEVNVAGVSDVGQSAEDNEAPAPAARLVADNAAAGPFFGLGAEEEDGTVTLNPEREFGLTYLLNIGPGNNPRVARWVKDDSGEGSWLVQGYVTRYRDTTEFECMLQNRAANVVSWVKARMRRTSEPRDDANMLAMLQRHLAEQKTEWESLNESLNEMATDKGHCSDYDAIVEAVGMTPRTKTWDVEVEVEVEFTDNSPSSALDSRLGHEYGISMEASSITVTAKLTVTVSGVEASTAAAVREAITVNDIESRLGDDLPSDFEITDWSVIDVARGE